MVCYFEVDLRFWFVRMATWQDLSGKILAYCWFCWFSCLDVQFQARNLILNLCWDILRDKSPLHHISKSNNCHGVLNDLGTILTHSEAKSRVAPEQAMLMVDSGVEGSCMCWSIFCCCFIESKELGCFCLETGFHRPSFSKVSSNFRHSESFVMVPVGRWQMVAFGISSCLKHTFVFVFFLFLSMDVVS